MADISEFLNEQFAAEDGAAGEGTAQTTGAADLGANDDGANVGTEPLPEGDTFKRDYVEKIRRESASYRERAKAAERYKEAFEGYDEDGIEEWFSFVKGLRDDPQSTAKQMAELSQHILKQYEVNAETGEIQPEGTAKFLGEVAKPLTMADYERLRASERADSEKQQLVQKIQTDATALGYEVGSLDYKLLLNTAMELPDGNIQKAHEKLQQRDQAIIDRYVADASARGGRRVPVNGIATGQQERSLKTWGDSRDALEEFINAQPL